MKALTIIQPYATLLALGIKRVEARRWRTDYRGPLALHAAEVYPPWAKDLAAQEPYRTVLHQAGYRHWIDLPTGAVIAVCQLDDCCLIVAPPDELEAGFDTYPPGHYSWQLSRVQQLAQPVRARDGVGLWEWRVPPQLADTLGDWMASERCTAPAAPQVFGRRANRVSR